MKKQMKRIMPALLALIFVIQLAACAAEDSCMEISKEELSENAVEIFEKLDGKYGVYVYNDNNQTKRNSGCLYVVLYGISGQTLSLNKERGGIVMEISGEPEDGFAVWRVKFGRSMFSQRDLRFTQNGAPQTLDGVLSKIEFIVEKALE